MDVELHNALRSGYAKRLLQLFTVRAAAAGACSTRGCSTCASSTTCSRCRRRSGGRRRRAPASRPPSDARRARRARRGARRRAGKGRYELRLAAGERLLAAGYQRGTGGADGVADRMLLWHLRALGFGAPQARELVRTRPDQVRTVLRRVYYLRRTRAGSPTAARSRTGARGRAPPSRATTPSATPSGSAGSPAQPRRGQRGEWGAGEAPRPALRRPPRSPAGGAGEGRRVIVTPSPARRPGPTPRADSRPPAHEVRSFPDNLWGQALERSSPPPPSTGARTRRGSPHALDSVTTRGHGRRGGRVHGRVDRAEVSRPPHRPAVRRRGPAGGLTVRAEGQGRPGGASARRRRASPTSSRRTSRHAERGAAVG
jgi:hypothetical protein